MSRFSRTNGPICNIFRTLSGIFHILNKRDALGRCLAYLVLVKDMKKLETIWNSKILYTGAITKHPKVIVKRAKKIKVTSDPVKPEVAEEVNIEYDGEVGLPMPAEFEIIDKSLNFRF